MYYELGNSKDFILYPDCDAFQVPSGWGFYIIVMAEGKKSFLIYCDIIQAVEHLTNEEKGRLFQHLLEYVNDMNPVLDDRMLIGSWKHIEMQLKRDLVKWEDIKGKRSEAGKKGANKRWQNIANDSKGKQTITKMAVTVNDTVSVNDNVNVINLIDDLVLNEIFLERCCRLHRNLTPSSIKNYLNSFENELALTDKTHDSQKEYKKHFLNWFKIQIKNNPPTIVKEKKILN